MWEESGDSLFCPAVLATLSPVDERGRSCGLQPCDRCLDRLTEPANPTDWRSFEGAFPVALQRAASAASAAWCRGRSNCLCEMRSKLAHAHGDPFVVVRVQAEVSAIGATETADARCSTQLPASCSQISKLQQPSPFAEPHTQGASPQLTQQHDPPSSPLGGSPISNNTRASSGYVATPTERPEELVFQHYLRLVQQDQSRAVTMDGPPGWKPKGVAALFAALSPSVEPLDPQSLTAGLLKVLQLIAPVLAPIQWLLVAPFLWGIRQLVLYTDALVALVVALIGFAIMVTVDEIAWSRAVKRDQQREDEAAAASSLSQRRAHAMHLFAASKPVPPPAPAAATAAAAPAAASASNPVSRSAAVSTKPKEDPALQQVRSAVIKLEAVLYGNELSNGVLPADALPVRTQKLCEEVGLPVPPCSNAAEMLQALQQVQAEIGV